MSTTRPVFDLQVAGVPVRLSHHALVRMSDRKVSADDLLEFLRAEPAKLRAVVQIGKGASTPKYTLRFRDITLVVTCRRGKMVVISMWWCRPRERVQGRAAEA